MIEFYVKYKYSILLSVVSIALAIVCYSYTVFALIYNTAGVLHFVMCILSMLLLFFNSTTISMLLSKSKSNGDLIPYTEYKKGVGSRNKCERFAVYKKNRRRELMRTVLNTHMYAEDPTLSGLMRNSFTKKPFRAAYELGGYVGDKDYLLSDGSIIKGINLCSLFYGCLFGVFSTKKIKDITSLDEHLNDGKPMYLTDGKTCKPVEVHSSPSKSMTTVSDVIGEKELGIVEDLQFGCIVFVVVPELTDGTTTLFSEDILKSVRSVV